MKVRDIHRLFEEAQQGKQFTLKVYAERLAPIVQRIDVIRHAILVGCERHLHKTLDFDVLQKMPVDEYAEAIDDMDISAETVTKLEGLFTDLRREVSHCS